MLKLSRPSVRFALGGLAALTVAPAYAAMIGVNFVGNNASTNLGSTTALLNMNADQTAGAVYKQQYGNNYRPSANTLTIRNGRTPDTTAALTMDTAASPSPTPEPAAPAPTPGTRP